MGMQLDQLVEERDKEVRRLRERGGKRESRGRVEQQRDRDGGTEGMRETEF